VGDGDSNHGVDGELGALQRVDGLLEPTPSPAAVTAAAVRVTEVAETERATETSER
jgi:hypothetical protein